MRKGSKKLQILSSDLGCMFLVLPFIRFVIGRTCRRISLWGILRWWSPKRCNSYSITEFFSLTFHCWTLARKFKNSINIYNMVYCSQEMKQNSTGKYHAACISQKFKQTKSPRHAKVLFKISSSYVYLLCPSSVNFDGSCELCPFTQTKYRQKLQLRENTVITSTVFSQWWLENKKRRKNLNWN